MHNLPYHKAELDPGGELSRSLCAEEDWTQVDACWEKHYINCGQEESVDHQEGRSVSDSHGLVKDRQDITQAIALWWKMSPREGSSIQCAQPLVQCAEGSSDR